MRLVPIGVVAALLVSAPRAAAQPAPPGEELSSGWESVYLPPPEPHHRIWGELAFSLPGGTRRTFVRPEVAARVFLLRYLAIEASLGVVFADDSDDSEVCAMNPFAGAFFWREGRDLSFHAGGGFTIPLATADVADDIFEGAIAFGLCARALDNSVGMDGATEPWLSAFDTLSFVTRAGIEYAHWFYGSAQLAAAVLIPTSHTSSRDVEPVVVPSVALGVDVQGIFRVGTRFNAAVFSSEAQISIEPFLRGAIGRAFLSVWFTFNVDEPYGELLDDRAVWALHLGGGAEI